MIHVDTLTNIRNPRLKQIGLCVSLYAVIDFNEVDIRIYQPEKVNITFKGR